jgi:hypothetical protein
MFRVMLILALLLPAQAFAEEHQFSEGAAVSIEPDEAYILVRTIGIPGRGLSGTLEPAPLLIRVVSEKEVDSPNARGQGVSNVFEPLADRPYEKNGDEETLLISVPPGTYVFGAVAVTNWAMKSRGRMIASLCMGTVMFDAKPGVITDMGTILIAGDEQPTDIPELASVVSGKPRGFYPDPYDIAIRPAASATAIPEALKSLPTAPADYRAVGMFPNYMGAQISRLAPLPGVLAYDRNGNVIDLKAARATSGQTPSAGAPPVQNESAVMPENPDRSSPSPRTHLPFRP